MSVSTWGQEGRAEPGSALVLDVAGAEPLPDGTWSLRNGDELVIAGLDVGLGLSPATKAYLAEVRKLAQAAGGWRIHGALRDRYQRLTGRLETAEGDWVQERLLRLGLARYAGGIPDRSDRRALLATEGVARAEGRGIWRNPRYIIRQAERMEEIYDGFQVVEGRVRDVGRGDGVVYLNFGEDWRTDFTAGVTVRLGPLDFDPEGSADSEAGPPRTVFDLQGRMVRLRGVVRRYNGPYMEIAGADQIELIGEGAFDPVRLRSTGPSDPRPVSESTL